MKPNYDTANFLEALLFAYHDEEAVSGRTVFEFSPEFTAGVESFIDGFREYLDARGIEIPDSPRSFGGNVYFSLSGHGCGFRDDEETEHLQTHLDAYSGNHYRFEQIDLCDDGNGNLDLSFIPSAIAEYRSKLFTV